MHELLDKIGIRYLTLALRFLLLALVALLVTRGVLPIAKDYLALRESRTLIEQVMSADTDAKGEIADLSNSVKELEHRVTGDMANLPGQQMEAFVLGRLQTISWRNEIILSSVRPTLGEQIQQYRELLFRVELNGDYFDMLDWLRDVTDELGFVVVKEYQMSVSNPRSKPPALTTRLLMAAYRLEAE